ncbi:hypothetical protein IMG5_126740, partial [Ichthyophthirius multifiliis]
KLIKIRIKQNMVNAWSVAWTIGNGRRSDFTQGQQFIPGPGAYNVDKKQIMVPPKWKIGSESRGNQKPNQNPGPGQYSTKTYVDQGSKYTIGNSTKPIGNTFQLVPGPGAYNINKSIQKRQPQYSMRIKNNTQERVFTPGPGEYQSKSFVFNKYKRSVVFSKQKRDDLYQQSISPGPGNYDNLRPKSAAPEFKFGSEQRDCLYRTQQTPGPGHYEQKPIMETGRGKTMFSRKNYEHISQVPGPGQYQQDTSIIKNKKPSFIIGTQSRDSLLNYLNNNPGPGSYQPQIDASRVTSSKIRIGTDIRKPLNNIQQNPGPGQYEYHPKTADGPKLSFKGVVSQNPVDLEKIRVPGPGTYEPNQILTKRRPFTSKIGTGLRKDLYMYKEAPGPGYYNLKKDPRGPKWVFGSEIRDQQKHIRTPGPGAYDLPVVLADLPKYAMTKSAYASRC